MYFVYVLRSLKTNTFYIGHTGKEPEERLREHNQTKQSRYDRAHAPFALLCQETLPSRSDAMKREKSLKSGQGRQWLKEKF